MPKLYPIKLLKDTEKGKKDEIYHCSKKDAESYIKNGYAEYVEEPKKKKIKKKSKEERELKIQAKKLGGKIKNKTKIANISIDMKEHNVLKKKWENNPSTWAAVEKEIEEKIKHYSIFPFEENKEPCRERKITIQKTKDSITLINEDVPEEEEEEIPPEEIKEKLRENYYEIIEVLKEYLDLREDYYELISLWIIGTYLHKEFKSYPYLYITAMRGSGKTRLLELISILSKDGELLTSLKEAVLFRTAEEVTFCIDEFERVSGKEKAELRQLLNSAYKKGMKVKRMKKQGDEMVVEEFSVYAPIAMANIWGMEEVLGDRCIPLVLEKSSVDRITKKVEDFEDCENVSHIKDNFKCSLCSVVTIKNIYSDWNSYINNKYPSPTTNYTQHKQHTTTLTTLKTDCFNNKIDEKNISGRNLELFFPLFVISEVIGEDVLEKILGIAERIISERKVEEQTESKDVMLIDFISQQSYVDFIPVKEITEKFKEFLREDEEEGKWTNTKWVGRALRRLNLIVNKRRLGRGVEVIPDVVRAKKKILMFRPETPSEQQKPINNQIKQKELGNNIKDEKTPKKQ